MKRTAMPMNRAPIAAVVAAAFLLSSGCAVAADTLSLAGEWRVKLDPKGEGVAAGWPGSELAGATAARLPGSLTTNGIGDEVSLKTPWTGYTGRGAFETSPRYAPYRVEGAIKVPFWLQPVKYYRGKAWYARDIEIPSGWAGRHTSLLLERCHWGTSVWVDGRFAGSENSLGAPHHHELGVLSPGRHRLTLCVDNDYLIRVGPDASSITDHTQTNWNGVVGRIELRADEAVSATHLRVDASIDGAVKIVVSTVNRGAAPAIRELRLVAREKASGRIAGESVSTVSVPVGAGKVAAGVSVAEPKLWSEFTPTMYTLEARLAGPGLAESVVSTPFGFREIRADGRTLKVNGTPVFLRGNLDCAAFPITGHPSTDVAEWRRIFKVYKAYGLNHVRFHSWCPPEAAFDAADELGLYLQPECGVWRGTCPLPKAAPVEPYLYAEGERICREYGNHPSFALFTHGNEPWELDQQKLSTEWVPAMKRLDSRHLVCAGSHYPVHPNNDYHLPGAHGAGFYLRYHGRFNTPPATLRNYESEIAKVTAPCVSHEPGEWCVFPNLREIGKYTGVLKAKNFEIVRDFMRDAGLLALADDFLMASGRFQTLVYKEEIEAFLRTRGLGGFQLLGLNDFPGQGTALVGVVDAFWDAKPYVTPVEFRRFCGPVTPLALMEKRVWTNDERFSARIRIAQYSGAPLRGVTPEWTVSDDTGAVVARGAFATGDIPVGNGTDPGVVELPLAGFGKPARLTLRVRIPGTEADNSWRFWVYPKSDAAAPDGVIECDDADTAIAALKEGRPVLLNPDPKRIPGDTHGTFQPIFWNKNWFPGQREHTLGLLIRKDHPALAGFPTDMHADWQWWDPMQNGKPMILDGLKERPEPIVRPIDDWNTCRNLALLLEAKVGPGRLMLCSIDLRRNLDTRPVARALRESLLRHMASPAFRPEASLSEAEVRSLVTPTAADGGFSPKASSAAPTNPAALAADGDPATFWRSAAKKPYPHEFRMEFPDMRGISGVNLMPRADSSAGRVKSVEIALSDDGAVWRVAATADLADNQEWKRIGFAASEARFVRVRCLSPRRDGDTEAAFAEVLPAGETRR